MKKVEMSQWKWFGCPGHFIGADECRFHLCTVVGEYVISTLGEWVPGESGFEEIGYKRKYETMVFRAGTPCAEPGCACGFPKPTDHSELDMDGYNHAGDATRGHLAMCQKWSERRLDGEVG